MMLQHDPRFERNGVSASRVVCPVGVWPIVFDFLCERFPFISSEQWRSRFDREQVLTANGQPFRIDAAYSAGQIVCYFRENNDEKKLPFQESIVYQDERIVVADKPHFLPVVPSGQYVQETLLARLKQKLRLPELTPAHRIDRDTAGLVLFSVNANQRSAYHNLFKNGLIQKQYQALAPCVKAAREFTFPKIIANRLETGQHFMQMHCVPGPVNASTEILSIDSLPENTSIARYTLRPLTGKRHQLRVHMMGIGAPIIGDAIYPVLIPERDVSLGTCPPLQLLAQTLMFTDPFTHKTLRFESQRRLVLG